MESSVLRRDGVFGVGTVGSKHDVHCGNTLARGKASYRGANGYNVTREIVAGVVFAREELGHFPVLWVGGSVGNADKDFIGARGTRVS